MTALCPTCGGSIGDVPGKEWQIRCGCVKTSALQQVREALEHAHLLADGVGDINTDGLITKALTLLSGLEAQREVDGVEREQIVERMAAAGRDACVKTYDGHYDGDSEIVHKNIAQASLTELLKNHTIARKE